MYYEKNHGLEVRLRPEDKYCKPALARSVPVTNMVIRVRRRRRKEEGGREEEGGDRSERSECHVEVLGLVKQNFEFTGIHMHNMVRMYTHIVHVLTNSKHVAQFLRTSHGFFNECFVTLSKHTLCSHVSPYYPVQVWLTTRCYLLG